MSHEATTTIDHNEIRSWVEKHNGKPATVAGTERRGEEAGLLRIDLPGGASNPPLEPISWEDFFAKFDEEQLAFLYQEKTVHGKASHFCKFITRESAKERSRK